MSYKLDGNDLGEASKVIKKLINSKQSEVSERTVSIFGYNGYMLDRIMETFKFVFFFEQIDYYIQRHRVTGEIRYIMK